jgi:hypothetical protein
MAGMVDGLAARLKALPDGALLRFAFLGLAGLAALMVATDFRDLVNGEASASLASPALDPVRMSRPSHNDQIRPYLPATRPVAPNDPGADLRKRPREESEAAPMHFRLGTHGAAFAEGTIMPGTADAFAEFVASERAASVTEIVLHSPGGSVADAIAMAHLIREKGLNTRILADGYCASSCPLVFAGGGKRIADATSWIGVHQAFAATDTFGSLAEGMDEGQRVGAEAQNLLAEFGVDPLVWTRAMATPSDKLYLFTPAELTELKLATKVEGKANPGGAEGL